MLKQVKKNSLQGKKVKQINRQDQILKERICDEDFNYEMILCRDREVKMKMYVRLLDRYLNVYNKVDACLSLWDFFGESPRYIYKRTAEFLNNKCFTQKNGNPWTACSLEKELTKYKEGFYDNFKIEGDKPIMIIRIGGPQIQVIDGFVVFENPNKIYKND